jgi:peptidoglycan/xylan/chitin deacetylase (PgdA/CDA1 family)
MTRKLGLFLLLALFVAFSFNACDKVKSLVSRKKADATPAPTAQSAPAPAASAAGPATDEAAAVATEESPAASGKPPIDTKAQVVVLCYHRLEGKAGGINSIEPALFEKHMASIKESGVPVISMQDFLAWRRGEKNLPPKSILITLDDGYISEVEVGVPILKKYGFTATFFVYLDYINKGGKSVSWTQLAELRDQGFEIGSHTVSHLDLRHKPAKVAGDYDTWLKDEVGRSKKVLEENLGIKCATIAYPFGNHNEKVQEATRAAGYEAGFTTYGARLGHTTNAFTLGRYDVTAKMPGNQDTFTVATTFSGMVAPSGPPVMAQDASVSMITEPMNGTTITNPTPTLKANLATMGALDPGSVVMRISGLGQVPAKFDPASKMITFPVATPLKPGGYTVIIGAKSGGRAVETRWMFTFDPNGPAAEAAAATAATPPQKKTR